MNYIVIALIFVIYWGVFKRVNGQNVCVPRPVTSVQIASNATLSWLPDANEECEITEFQLDIVGNREDEYHFKVKEYSVDLSYMNICEDWMFTITPISYEVIGYRHVFYGHIPVPPDADLSISYFNATILEKTHAILHWDLNNRTHGDCTLVYRLSIIDEQLEIINDILVGGSQFSISFVSPCVPYFLEIRTINRAHPTIEGPLETMELSFDGYPQTAPRIDLETLIVRPTSINMTWALQGVTNRCPLIALHVDAGNDFNISVPLQDFTNSIPVELNYLRPNTMYYMRVSVENSAGISPSVPIAIQTPDLPDLN